MKRNPGHLPHEAEGKRVRVGLANGHRPSEPWAADGRGACRWTLTGSPFDIEFYEVVA